MERGKQLLKAITGGILIGLGGTCFLSVDNKVLGAFMFSLGLYAICVTGQLLFTGRASYTDDFIELLIVLLGNYIGANIIGILMGVTNISLHEKAVAMCQSKIENEMIFVLAFFCNILIYFAVEGYKNGQPLLLILCVMAFILCGFEHSIADMYYFAVARMYQPIHFLFILAIILGNYSAGCYVRIFRQLTT